MKSNRTASFFKHSLTTVLGACLFLGLTNAQSSDAVGKFTLPFEATWGNAVLPVGHYSFRVTHTAGSSSMFIAVKSGPKLVALVMASSVSESKPSDDNALVAVRNGGQHSIQLLKLGCIGQTYTYMPPKGAKPSLIAQGSRLVEHIPITIAGE